MLCTDEKWHQATGQEDMENHKEMYVILKERFMCCDSNCTAFEKMKSHGNSEEVRGGQALGGSECVGYVGWSRFYV